MRKALTILSLLWFLPLWLFAEGWSAETLPMVHLQNARRYVCNPDGILTQAAVDSTDHILYTLENEKGIQTVVVVVKQIEGGEAYTFGMNLSRKYGIGTKAQNNGLIVILATENKSYSILTGTGMEGTLPDALCRRIENRVMVPQLKAKNWDKAVLYTIKSIDTIVRNDEGLTAEKQNKENKDGAFGGLIFVALFLFIIFAVEAYQRRKVQCPHCHTPMQNLGHQSVRNDSGANTNATLYRCPQCGYTQYSRHNTEGYWWILYLLLSILSNGTGRRNHDDRSSGGTFGGGSFGGGGSSGRF